MNPLQSSVILSKVSSDTTYISLFHTWDLVVRLTMTSVPRDRKIEKENTFKTYCEMSPKNLLLSGCIKKIYIYVMGETTL